MFSSLSVSIDVGAYKSVMFLQATLIHNLASHLPNKAVTRSTPIPIFKICLKLPFFWQEQQVRQCYGINIHLLTPQSNVKGYIGGSVLWRLLHHKDAANFNLKVLVRSAEKAKIFSEKFGIDAIVGSYQEEDKLENLAAEADYVFAIVRLRLMLTFRDLLANAKHPA